MTPADLTTFLDHLRHGRPPAAPLACGRAAAFHHTGHCPPPLAAAIARLANRPLPGLTLYKFGSRAIVGSHTLDCGDRVVLKYYYPSNTARHLAYGVRGSRCMRSWLAGAAFTALGIPTPAPLVIAEWSRFGGLWLSKSFLATRPATGVPLDAFIHSHGTAHPLLEAAAASLRASFSTMAAHAAIHGDLKANNLLIDDHGTVSFIDLDAAACQLPKATWETLREKDRQRFFANWKHQPDAARLFHHVFDPS